MIKMFYCIVFLEQMRDAYLFYFSKLAFIFLNPLFYPLFNFFLAILKNYQTESFLEIKPVLSYFF